MLFLCPSVLFLYVYLFVWFVYDWNSKWWNTHHFGTWQTYPFICSNVNDLHSYIWWMEASKWVSMHITAQWYIKRYVDVTHYISRQCMELSEWGISRFLEGEFLLLKCGKCWGYWYVKDRKCLLVLGVKTYIYLLSYLILTMHFTNQTSPAHWRCSGQVMLAAGLTVYTAMASLLYSLLYDNTNKGTLHYWQ